MGRMRLGLLLRNGTLRVAGQMRTFGWGELREMARLAEAVGFDTLFVEDHFLFRFPPPRVPLLRSRPDDRGFWESWVLLSALAEATSRIELGPLVACTSFRNPALLARMADSLDEVSGGRLILGLGAGWHEPEFDAFGYPFDHRVSRFEEALRIIVPLLRHGHVDFKGRYYAARDCELRPRGPRPGGPPIWIGARQPRMLRLAARYADAFNTVWHPTPDSAAAELARFRQACQDVGRDPRTVLLTAGAFVALRDPGDSGGKSSGDVIAGTAEELAERLHAFSAVGVQHLTCTLDPWMPQTIERFAPVVEALAAR
jgi:probable F420-dependent oxidoreductase